MKVLLRSDIDGVGKRGDIIDVSGGFARNHLLPAGKAVAASAGIEGQAAAMRRSRDLRDARDRESSETVARTLVGNVITERISVEDGAVLKGGVEVRSGHQKQKGSSQSQGKTADAPKPAPAEPHVVAAIVGA